VRLCTGRWRIFAYGGRESKVVEAFDFASKTWTKKAEAPVLFHHFQAINLGWIIVAVGAMTGGCCEEPGVPNMYFYDPIGDA
jgi:hypothetical protein